MNIEEILKEYDSLFGRASMEDIEDFLKSHIEKAERTNDEAVMFTLLNEMIGFCRDTTQKEKGLDYCNKLKELLSKMQLEERIEGATAFLNIANAYRAFGLLEESLKLYTAVEVNYNVNLPQNAFQYASLYNNWSLLYQEMQQFGKAKEMLFRALKIVDSYENAKIEQATTRTNLANSLLQLNTETSKKEAKKYLSEAIMIFEEDGCTNFHYGAAVVAMGDLHFAENEYQAAAKYYKLGMDEIYKHVGKTDNYYRVKEKYEYVIEKNNKLSLAEKNLDRCRGFYEKYGKKMIAEEFAEYESRIAVGMVGEGSDCFGYDDEISKDHDYGVGFCMWLTDEDAAKISNSLQASYERLINSHFGIVSNDLFYSTRRGVFTINEFYEKLLQYTGNYEKGTEIDYLQIQEQNLAAATNGEIFRDDLGLFSSIRNKIAYYPEKIWRMRLAKSLHDFSQYAQSNYPRMMSRKDYVTANLCISKAAESSMDIAYLLNRKYAPYYKWKKKGLDGLEVLSEIGIWLEQIILCPLQNDAWNDVVYSSSEINTKDKCVEYFEHIAEIILEEMNKQDLISGKDTFLEKCYREILEDGKMKVIEDIVKLEWKQFDKVKNEDGRADCQDDWDTFLIMRKSQYLTWNRELLNSYYNDLIMADSKGWNMIMEKYARMMQSTAPDRYQELKNQLPELTEERIKIQEAIIEIQIKWMEEFAEKYPKMAGNARSIHTYEDNAYNTSYETYLRGEIGTYSEETFMLYGRFITKLLQENKNLAYEIMNNTAQLYGYESVKEAESKL